MLVELFSTSTQQSKLIQIWLVYLFHFCYHHLFHSFNFFFRHFWIVICNDILRKLIINMIYKVLLSFFGNIQYWCLPFEYLHIHWSNLLFTDSKGTLTYSLLSKVHYLTYNKWVIWTSKSLHIFDSFLFDSICYNKVYLSPFNIGLSHIFIIKPYRISPIV